MSSIPDGHDLTSVEGRRLHQELQGIATTMLQGMQEIRSSVHESIADLAELVGRCIGSVHELRTDVQDVRHLLGMNGSAAHVPSPPAVPRPTKRMAPTRALGELPSIPPAFEHEHGIELTDTGNFRVDPQTFERISARLARIEGEKKMEAARAEGESDLRKRLAAENEALAKRVGFVIKVAGALIAACSTAAAAITWALHHVH